VTENEIGHCVFSVPQHHRQSRECALASRIGSTLRPTLCIAPAIAQFVLAAFSVGGVVAGRGAVVEGAEVEKPSAPARTASAGVLPWLVSSGVAGSRRAPRYHHITRSRVWHCRPNVHVEWALLTAIHVVRKLPIATEFGAEHGLRNILDAFINKSGAVVGACRAQNRRRIAMIAW